MQRDADAVVTMVRSIVSVIVGYFVFALSAFALFQVSGQPPQRVAPVGFVVGSIIYGSAFACLGGYVAAWVAKRRPLAHGIAVGIIFSTGCSGFVAKYSRQGRGLVASCGSAADGTERRVRRVVA